MIKSPRTWNECHFSISQLPITKIWFVGYTEGQLVGQIQRFIEESHYDNYLICVDDLRADKKSFAIVENMLLDYPAVTGYSNFVIDSDRVNLKLRDDFTDTLTTSYVKLVHRFPSLGDIMRPLNYTQCPRKKHLPDVKDFRTYWTGEAFFGMRKELWLKFPYKPLVKSDGRTCCSDYSISYRLAKACIPIMTESGAEFEHMNTKEGFIVGKINPYISLTV